MKRSGKPGILLVFIGELFVILSFHFSARFNDYYLSFDIFPDIIGFVLILIGACLLVSFHPCFSMLRILTAAQILAEILGWFALFYKFSSGTLGMVSNRAVFYQALDGTWDLGKVLLNTGSIALICMALAELANREGIVDLTHKAKVRSKMLIIFSVVVQVFSIVGRFFVGEMDAIYWILVVITGIFVIVQLVALILFLNLLYRAQKQISVFQSASVLGMS